MNARTHSAMTGPGDGRPPAASSKRPAFSLIEVMLALVLVAALTALAVPTFEQMLGSATLRETSRAAAAAIDEAGASSQLSGIPSDIAAVRAESGEWSLTATPLPMPTDPESETPVAPKPPPRAKTLFRLPPGFVIETPPPPPDAADADAADDETPADADRIPFCVLWPTGEATPRTTLRLRDPSGDWSELSVSPLTGRCRTVPGGVPDATAKPEPPARNARPGPALGAPEPFGSEAGAGP